MDKPSYVLRAALLAVRADVRAFKVFDIGTVVSVEGEVNELGFLPVSSDGVTYRVFERDLFERGTAIGARRAAC